MKQLRLFLLACAMLGLAAYASAQVTPRSYTSYFFFGDSLTDMGNTFFVAGQPPPPYYNGRFSNGPTYAEYLVNGLQRSLTAPPSATTNLNFAFAGATATTAYMGPTTPAYLGQEVGMFQARGIAPKATDMFVVWAGANDVLNYLGSTATPSGDGANTAATAAVSAVASSVQTLATAGAKNFIVMTLPDISRTARFTTGSAAPAASLAQGAVYTYGKGIRTSLASIAASTGANITLVDTTALLNTIILNAGKFGFTDTTHDVIDILGAGGSVANPNSYIFWDGIHPTTAVHALFAAAMTEIMNPEFELGNAAVQSNAVSLGADVIADSLEARLTQVRGSTSRHPADGFVSYNYASGGLNSAGYRNAFDYSGSVITAGFDGKYCDTLTLGLAASAETFNAKVKPGAGSFTLNGHLVTAYAQWRPSTFFVEAYGSFGAVNLDKIIRVTSLGLPTSGSTTGNQRAFGVKAGADFQLGGAHISPFIGARYLAGRIDGYTETNVGGLNFSYRQHDIKPITAMAGIDGLWNLHLGEMPLTAGLSCVFQGSSNGGNQPFSGQLADTVTSTTTIQTDTSGGTALKLGARLSGTFSKRWSWTVGYTSDARSDGKTGSQAGVSLQTGF